MNLGDLESMIKGRGAAARGMASAWMIQSTEEDMDVLRRHAPRTTYVPGGLGMITVCAYEWNDAVGRAVEWTDCLDVQSLFRRYGTAPTE